MNNMVPGAMPVLMPAPLGFLFFLFADRDMVELKRQEYDVLNARYAKMPVLPAALAYVQLC
jgi:hypothetical protein